MPVTLNTKKNLTQFRDVREGDLKKIPILPSNEILNNKLKALLNRIPDNMKLNVVGKKDTLEKLKTRSTRFTYSDLSDEEQNNREYALTALLGSGGEFKNLPEQFKDDKDIVLAVVFKTSMAIQHASPTLKDDFDVVWEAVNKAGGALKFASKRLKQNEELVYLALRSIPTYYLQLSPKMKANIEITLFALKETEGNTHWISIIEKHIPTELKQNARILEMLETLKINQEEDDDEYEDEDSEYHIDEPTAFYDPKYFNNSTFSTRSFYPTVSSASSSSSVMPAPDNKVTLFFEKSLNETHEEENKQPCSNSRLN
ncbi:MAG: DUF4116 domain-containing protein [Legionella sp.]|nr:DUF4116 domain-containing protein [Legionella sp.]